MLSSWKCDYEKPIWMVIKVIVLFHLETKVLHRIVPGLRMGGWRESPSSSTTTQSGIPEHKHCSLLVMIHALVSLVWGGGSMWQGHAHFSPLYLLAYLGSCGTWSAYYALCDGTAATLVYIPGGMLPAWGTVFPGAPAVAFHFCGTIYSCLQLSHGYSVSIYTWTLSGGCEMTGREECIDWFLLSVVSQ